MEEALKAYPIFVVPSPWIVLFIVSLAVLSYIYEKYYKRSFQVYLSVSKDEREQYETLMTEYRQLKAEADKYAKNNSTFAQHSIAKRKMIATEAQLKKLPEALMGGAIPARAKTISSLPIYVALALTVIMFRNETLFSFVDAPDAPQTECLEAIFHTLFWPLSDAPDVELSRYTFSFSNLTDTLANTVSSCLPTSYLFTQSLFSIIILYNMASTCVQFAIETYESLQPEKKAKFF